MNWDKIVPEKEREMGDPSLKLITAVSDGNASANIVLLHGLNGDWRSTWAKGNCFWPDWLKIDIPNIAVYSVSYDAPLISESLPIADKATAILQLLLTYNLKNTIFIAHSMGGLVTKCILRHSFDSQEEFGSIFHNTVGVVFIATPHTGSALAGIGLALGLKGNVPDLLHDSSYLHELNGWYRNHCNKIKHQVFYETKKMFGVAKPVARGSADIGIPNVTPIPLDRDHSETCKFADQEDFVYRSIVNFVQVVTKRNLDPEVERLIEATQQALLHLKQPSCFFPRTVAADGGLEMASLSDCLDLVLRSKRVILKGGAGQGKSSFVVQLAQLACEVGILPVVIQLKNLELQFPDELSKAPDWKSKVDIILNAAIVDITIENLVRLSKPVLIIADGVNEISVAQHVTAIFNETVRHLSHVCVMMTDRLQQPQWENVKWKKWSLLPISEGYLRLCIEETFGTDEVYDQLTEIEKELLYVPYFLDQAIYLKDFNFGSQSETIKEFFVNCLHLSHDELDDLSSIAYNSYIENGSTSFPSSAVKSNLFERLCSAGVLIKTKQDGQRVVFDHQLKHDYLASRVLARDSKLWNEATFNKVTFFHKSVEVLAMALQQVKDFQNVDYLITSIYDWSWPMTIDSLSEAKRTGKLNLGRDKELMVLGVTADKRFDSILNTRQRAHDALLKYPDELARKLVNASTIEEIYSLFQGYHGGEEYLSWVQLFTNPTGVNITEDKIYVLITDDPIIGWTASNAFRRCNLNESRQLQLRTLYNALKDLPKKWRILHTLGAYPSSTNSQLLLSALEKEKNWELQYGAARSLVEYAARTTDSMRDNVLNRLSNCKGLRGTVVREIGAAAFNFHCDEAWIKAATPMLYQIGEVFSKDNTAAENWSALVERFCNGEWLKAPRH